MLYIRFGEHQFGNKGYYERQVMMKKREEAREREEAKERVFTYRWYIQRAFSRLQYYTKDSHKHSYNLGQKFC